MTDRIRASLPLEALVRLVARQGNALLPDGDDIVADDLMPSAGRALERLEHCFSRIANKYFFDGTQAVFDHLHGDQYCMWLYLLSSQLHRDGAGPALCSKLFLLNKALHGCDLFYEVALPDIFLLVHPLGTVLGRGTYADYFVAYQRCGVGSNRDAYPTFGEHVTLRPGSAVLGNCRIGHHCQIAAESLVLDRDLPDHSLYIGNPKNAMVKRQETPYPLWRA
jgi:serine O-acetyltransferase